MDKSISSYIKIGGIGTLEFIFAFFIGTILDIVFFKVYKKLDPKQKSLSILLILILLQLFTIIFLISNFMRFGIIDSYFLRLGIVVSQIFLIDFSIKRLSNIFYNRKN